MIDKLNNRNKTHYWKWSILFVNVKKKQEEEKRKSHGEFQRAINRYVNTLLIVGLFACMASL
jgi:hypothetical protein